jgi:hypothetical protein
MRSLVKLLIHLLPELVINMSSAHRFAYGLTDSKVKLWIGGCSIRSVMMAGMVMSVVSASHDANNIN